ncbi:MAG: MrpF/PhaF family protein, partial [Bacteroidales bacterium]|nr:MrpF/PhaF family protein [Bacteroidales bacterium]
VVALDLIASVVAGIILVYMIRAGEKRYLDIVVVLSLIVFMGTVAIARFLNKNKNDN